MCATVSHTRTLQTDHRVTVHLIYCKTHPDSFFTVVGRAVAFSGSFGVCLTTSALTAFYKKVNFRTTPLHTVATSTSDFDRLTPERSAAIRVNDEITLSPDFALTKKLIISFSPANCVCLSGLTTLRCCMSTNIALACTHRNSAHFC